MKSRLYISLRLFMLWLAYSFTENAIGQVPTSSLSAQSGTPALAPSLEAPSLLLTGIASIGEQKFVYLIDPHSSQSIELVSGVPNGNGIELLKVQDEGLAAVWKVLIRQKGAEYWLSFAAPSKLAASSGTAILSATASVPVVPPADFKRSPPQNAGTMSNDTPSAAVRKRPLHTFPLPGGL